MSFVGTLPLRLFKATLISQFVLLLILSLMRSAAADVGVWKDIVKPGGKWVLRSTEKRINKQLIVSNYEVRTVGGAIVAKLRWVCSEANRTDIRDCRFSFLPSQIAINSRGVYFLEASDSDEKIIRAIAKNPTFVNPPTVSPNGHGLHVARPAGYVDKRKDVLCYNDSPPKGSPDCEDICYSDICLSRGYGIVYVSGNATSNADSYCQKQFCLF